MTTRVIVVGGGIAGLIGAIDLARSGVTVTVLESGVQVGGRARTRQSSGFTFNQGPHAVYLGGGFRKALDRLGVAMPGGSPRLSLASGVMDGRRVRLPVSLAALMRTRLFDLNDKIGFVRVQKLIASGIRPDGSLEDWLDTLGMSPRLRQAMEALVRLASYSNAPVLMSAAAALDQVRMSYSGVRYIDGGWSTLVGGLVQAAEAAGATIRTSALVQNVVPTDCGLNVRLQGEEVLIADAVLLAMGPHEAAALAPRAEALKRAADEAIPIRMNALDLGLEHLPDDGASFAQGIDQPFYHSQHSGVAKLASGEGAVVHVAKYLGPLETPTHTAITELEQYADVAMPGWRPLEVARQRLIGMTVSHAVVRWDVARPGVAVDGVPGLFVAGDWVGGEGMLSDAAAASAGEAAIAVAGYLAKQVRTAA